MSMTLGVLLLNGLITANKAIIFITPVVMVQHWNPDLKLAEGVFKGQIKTSHLSNLATVAVTSPPLYRPTVVLADDLGKVIVIGGLTLQSVYYSYSRLLFEFDTRLAAIEFGAFVNAPDNNLFIRYDSDDVGSGDPPFTVTMRNLSLNATFVTQSTATVSPSTDARRFGGWNVFVLENCGIIVLQYSLLVSAESFTYRNPIDCTHADAQTVP
ncbi:hypothetical protein H9P43_009452 [Blastocladiella emersonii ATCC 22665]|nr:hypothetical protein H9P43_009452 [Blastocladiella emersonii ATCC 22665]